MMVGELCHELGGPHPHFVVRAVGCRYDVAVVLEVLDARRIERLVERAIRLRDRPVAESDCFEMRAAERREAIIRALVDATIRCSPTHIARLPRCRFGLDTASRT